jgi:SAM-dependent methyltransferase
MDRSGERASHWDTVYGTKAPDSVSWFQVDPATSLKLIAGAGLRPGASVLDVGAGTSFLVDRLLDLGYKPGVLDVSSVALDMTKKRLGSDGTKVEWLVADVLNYEPSHRWDLWHDRAVFHFLTDEADRAAYWSVVRDCLNRDGKAVIATFGPNGPQRCSGLPTARYGPEELLREAGSGFVLADSVVDMHLTPGGNSQEFVYVLLSRDSATTSSNAV